MAVNKVVKSDGTTLIDLSDDTVTSSDHIMAGYVGHLADGSQVTGTGSGEDEDYALAEAALGSDGTEDLSVAITALTTYSNGVTGASDSTLSEAVATLVSGYGGGSTGATAREIIQWAFPDYDLTDYSVAEFTLDSNQTGSYFSVTNPAGATPVNIFVVKKDWMAFYSSGTSILVGGYNIGNVNTDSNDVNRTVVSQNTESYPFPNRRIMRTNYNLISTSCPTSDANTIYLRAGSGSQTKWYAGDYVIAVSTS